MKIIALTGGVGVGKSHIAHMFNVLYNIPVYISDDKVKKEIVNYPCIKRKIIDTFGTNSYEGGKYNVRKFRDLLFTDKDAMEKMNRIIIPDMLDDIGVWHSNQMRSFSGAPYTIVECAVVIEQNIYEKFDKTILVTAPINVRVDRLTKNRSMTMGDINSRIRNQESDTVKKLLSDYVIHNDGGALSNKIESVHNKILTFCGRGDLIHGISN